MQEEGKKREKEKKKRRSERAPADGEVKMRKSAESRVEVREILSAVTSPYSFVMMMKERIRPPTHSEKSDSRNDQVCLI